MCVLFYSSFVCRYACANVSFQTTITRQNIKIILIARVPSSQAFLGFLITMPPFVIVPDVIGVLAVWISNQKNKKNKPTHYMPHGLGLCLCLVRWSVICCQAVV